MLKFQRTLKYKQQLNCESVCAGVYIHSLYVYFGITVHIKNMQIKHRSDKLKLKNWHKNKNTVLYEVQ